MGPSLIVTFLVHGLVILELNAVRIGFIHNVSLNILNVKATMINGTCDECICSLLANATFFAVNCLADRHSCDLHLRENKKNPFNLITGSNASFYFLSLPTNVAPQVFTVEYLWTFDSTFQDTSSTFNGTPTNHAQFSSSTITGYGSSLSLNGSSNQSVQIDQPSLKLYNQSWTFEAWICLAAGMTGTDYPIVQQRELNVLDKRLHLLVRQRRLHLGFFADDLQGGTDLVASRWYHTAFVFDTVTRNQSVYLDGVLDGSRQANNSYQGINGSLHIGINYWPPDEYFFDGLIDQLSFTNRTKTSDEILRDATLVVYISFDGNSTLDEGPLGIDGSLAGSTRFVPGRRGQALQIDYVSDSYLTVPRLVLLGRAAQSYSFSIWVKPAVIRVSSIVQMSLNPDGAHWCLPMIGMTSAGELITVSHDGSNIRITGPVLPANSWTHAVATYSLTRGLRLYINGSLYNSSSPFSFSAAGAPTYLLIGSPRSGSYCGGTMGTSGQYSGTVDELQVYSRELNADDVSELANP